MHVRQRHPVKEADPNWAQEGRDWARRVRSSLGDLAIEVDHVGSTAVPGLPAKDVLDIQATVLDFEDAPIAPRLAASGFVRVQDVGADTRRPDLLGETGEADWLKQLYRAGDGVRGVHVHVRLHGGANARAALLLRDYLRADASARGEYGRLKWALSDELGKDWRGYAAVKEPALGLIMRLAADWALRTRWRPGAPDA